jgi:ribosomal-protein-serine acetyltransferase
MSIPVCDGIDLRPLTIQDAPALFAAVDRNRLRLRKWLPWLDSSNSIHDMRAFLEQQERENASRSSLTTGIWVNEEIRGCISLHHIDARHRSTSVGYWLDIAVEGRGVMTKACRALVTEGFRTYALHRIEIRCALGNLRSCAIPQRLGFVEEGILREAEWLDDHWVDLRVFSMLEQDWL